MITTPGQDYDDSYCIQYARKQNAFIVTNDKFRDYIEQFKDKILNPDGAKQDDQSKDQSAMDPYKKKTSNKK